MPFRRENRQFTQTGPDASGRRYNHCMKFVRESISAVTVRRIEPGRITIGDETHTGSVVLFRNSVERGWPAADDAAIGYPDIAAFLDDDPEIVLFGTGWESRLPPRGLVFELARKGIGFESMDTPAACRTYNILVSEGRDVAAFLKVD